MKFAERWHTLMGMVARRDRTVPLLLDVEVCTVTHPEFGQCRGIRNHGQHSPLTYRHGNERGGWE